MISNYNVMNKDTSKSTERVMEQPPLLTSACKQMFLF